MKSLEKEANMIPLPTYPGPDDLIVMNLVNIAASTQETDYGKARVAIGMSVFHATITAIIIIGVILFLVALFSL